MPTWVYIVFLVIVVVIFAMYMTCKGKDDQISDLTMEIHRIRSDADYNRKRAARRYECPVRSLQGMYRKTGFGIEKYYR